MLEYLLLDATDKILGRFCSQAAKKALLGDRVVIINAKHAIISGTKKNIHEK
ncbi:MAG: uL13 family ribosomal protein, partial [Promethearchaeota archaeon]